MHPSQLHKLEDIPNIGTSIAADLHGMGIHTPTELAAQDPLTTYLALTKCMGVRHDPCVLYALMAARHFLDCGEKLPWWHFTAQGKHILSKLD